jgi:hypothetical protein
VLVAILALAVGASTAALLYQLDGSESSSGNDGSGIPATQARDVGAFESIELAGSSNVVVHVGQRKSVVVKADDNLLDRVTTEVQSATLVISNAPGSFTTKSPMVVEITVPKLEALTLSGSGNIVVDGVESERLEVTLPGSGTLTASGTVAQLDVTLSGSGLAQFTALAASDVRALVSGSGSIFVTATKSLDASVSGSGAIVYTGTPQDVAKSVSGSGVITGG